MYTISFSAWLAIIIEYGFGISSTREIAGASDDKAVEKIVSSTQSAKYLLILGTLPVLALAVLFFPPFHAHWAWAFSAWTLGVLAGLQPTYYYQGKEQLRIVGYAEVAASCCFLGGVLLFIRKPSSAAILPVLLVLPRLLIFVFLLKRLVTQLESSVARLWNLQGGLYFLKSTFPFFVFQAAVGLYTSFNVVFLGFFCSPAEVGIYASAERVMRAGVGFLAQFSNAVFPRLNALKNSGSSKLTRARRLTLLGMTVLGLLGMTVTWLIAPYISSYFFGENGARVKEVLEILALLVPAIALSNVFGFQFLIVDRKETIFNYIIFAAASLNGILAFFMVSTFQVKGMAVTWVLVEWFIAISSMVAVAIIRNQYFKFGLSKGA
jgi:PST family polysaccharide transporter